MADAPPRINIGRLRFRVQVVLRGQTPDSTTGITEADELLGETWANITPMDAGTFYSSEQVDSPVTDRITMRWRGILDQRHAILHRTRLPDGTAITKTYRVRRFMQLDGRNRFVTLAVELEKTQTDAPATTPARPGAPATNPPASGTSDSPANKPFEYMQAKPAATWIIRHGFGFHPAVQVLDAQGEEVFPETIKHPDLNTTVLTFSPPEAGTATLT